MIRIFQIIAAPNDKNGNPRRITCQYSASDGNLVAAYEHGFRGDCIPLLGVEDVQLPTVRVDVSEYWDFKNVAKVNCTYHS